MPKAKEMANTSVSYDNERSLSPFKLTVQQEAFTFAYIEAMGNGTEAMMKVNPKLSPETAGMMASRYLGMDEVRKAIQSRMSEKVNETFVMTKLYSLGLHAEKEDTQLRATQTIGKFLGMESRHNNHNSAPASALQINIGVPSRKTANFRKKADVIDIEPDAQ